MLMIPFGGGVCFEETSRWGASIDGAFGEEDALQMSLLGMGGLQDGQFLFGAADVPNIDMHRQ